MQHRACPEHCTRDVRAGTALRLAGRWGGWGEAGSVWRTAKRASRQGLQKWWPQGVDSGSASTPLHSVHVNSRSALSCSDACAKP